MVAKAAAFEGSIVNGSKGAFEKESDKEASEHSENSKGSTGLSFLDLFSWHREPDAVAAKLGTGAAKLGMGAALGAAGKTLPAEVESMGK